MSTKTKIGLGSVLSTFGVLGIVLSLLLDWTAAPRPWGYLLGFVVGVVTGLGVTLVIAGLIDHRQGK
jgi:predicted ABC-type sugar transport system permease subunit